MKVRVRIAVAFDREEPWNWSATGFTTKQSEVGSPAWDKEMQTYALETVDCLNEYVAFVEAEVDVPDVATIPGKVVP